jgi:ribosomal protein S18 acetylase RimI-like enzyme
MTEMMLSIREACPQDIDAVVHAWQSCNLTRPWNDPASDFKLALESAASTIFLAVDGDTVIGTVMTGFDGHRGWIYYLGTLPVYRNRGIASQLIEAVKKWLADRNCPKVELMVRRGNPAADFYEKNGWEKQDVDVYAHWLNKEEN